MVVKLDAVIEVITSEVPKTPTISLGAAFSPQGALG